MKTVGVAIITHNAAHLIESCLKPLLEGVDPKKILVVNSSSNDGTVEKAKKLNVSTLVIPRKEFNHGTTRELARKQLGTDIVVMMTPDAIAYTNTLELMVKPLVEGKASIAYARQLPHKGADFFEAFPRQFNYPETSQLRSFEDREKYGVYTCFCSDSCAAYVNSALDEVGGFQSVLIAEDTLAVAELLKKGHKIAYVAEARVHHSHRYTLSQEFRRHFDTGLMRQRHKPTLEAFGSDAKRGRAFVKLLLKNLVKTKPALLPYACANLVVKALGYQVGKWGNGLPTTVKKVLSSQDFYW